MKSYYIIFSYTLIFVFHFFLPGWEASATENNVKYNATWESLDSRPLPQWYDQGKVGIFLHWGVFSVPAFKGAWLWEFWQTNKTDAVNYFKNNYSPNFAYQDFAADFTATFYDPVKWASIFEKAGAKYVVLTSKHHEGYAMWPSKYSFGWNAMDVGPKRDLLGDLALAIRNTTNLKFGLYHSWYEWFNRLYLADKESGYKTDNFVRMKALPELVELVNTYKPDVIWSDGDWEASDTYWKSKEFLAWLYNSSPVKDSVVVNDRWGNGTSCVHGGFYSCRDHYNPGHWVKHKWENAMTVDRNAWGFRRNTDISEIRSPQELIYELVSTVSCGGNFLLNVGPTKDGIIAPIMEERLYQMGDWLKVNGEAIYETVPWQGAQNDSITEGVWYTTNPAKGRLYAIILDTAWPAPTGGDDRCTIVLGSVTPSMVVKIEILGLQPGRLLAWAPCPHTPSSICMGKEGILVNLPTVPPKSFQFAWTLIVHLK